MNLLKKLILLKNDAGLVLTGLIFAVISGLIIFSGASDGSMMPLAFMGIGILLLVVGIIKLMKDLKNPREAYDQYDRVPAQAEAPVEYEASDEDDEEHDYVFHFTGKGNQSYVMKDETGTPVYEATTDKLLMIKARPFVFRNIMTGQEATKSVGAPVTISAGGGAFIGKVNISSTFKIDDEDVWDVIASMGYGFSFSLNGLAAHYDVRRYNQPVGFAELGGTGLMNPKYKDSALGKVPTNGIFKVHCKRRDIPGLFLICFAITHTEATVN